MNIIFKVLEMILVVLKYPLMMIGISIMVFMLLCGVWYIVLTKQGHKMQSTKVIRVKEHSLLRKLIIDLPNQYMVDKFNEEPNFFHPCGLHMFCGEQGSGKTIAVVHQILTLKKMYPMAKTITNFGLTTQTNELKKWQQLLSYNNSKQGVIVGMDEIQNWFQSGLNKMPEEMLEVATQNRKNRRIILATSQIFTRVNKGLREQVTMVYNPHTFLGCLTVVVKRKPKFDDEGNVLEMKYKGIYCFVHNKELREAYDTYKVIHALAKAGFKDVPARTEIKNYIVTK